MDGMDMQASFNNLTQADRIQQTRHSVPVVNQEQNAEIAKKSVEQKIDKPTEAEESEGKIVDTNDRKHDRSGRKKRKKEEKKPSKKHHDGDSGYFIDLSV